MGKHKFSTCGKVCLSLLCFAESNRSLLKDVIDLFRIFQRVSASRSFYARFSNDCYKLFEWATNIINIITEAFIPKEHLSMYELFQLYCLDSNIFMANFILILLSHREFITFIPLFGLAILFGIGYSYAKYNGLYVVIFLLVAAVLSIISICGLSFKCNFLDIFCSFYYGIRQVTAKGNKNLRENEFLKHTTMMLAGSIVFACVTSPIIIRHRVIGIYILLILSAIVIVTFIYESIRNCCTKKSKLSEYVIELVNQIIGLCLVPATECFIQLVLTNFGVKWNVVLSYIVLTVIFPIVINVALIISEESGLEEKYKEKYMCNCIDLRLIEIVDVLHKIAYAMLSALDIPYGCIGLEGAWFLIMIIIRPYTSYSDSVLNLGESLVMIIGNIAAVVGSGFFSFEVSVCFVALACAPVILSIIVYFAKDFVIEIEDDENSLDENIDSENDLNKNNDNEKNNNKNCHKKDAKNKNNDNEKNNNENSHKKDTKNKNNDNEKNNNENSHKKDAKNKSNDNENINNGKSHKKKVKSKNKDNEISYSLNNYDENSYDVNIYSENSYSENLYSENSYLENITRKKAKNKNNDDENSYSLNNYNEDSYEKDSYDENSTMKNSTNKNNDSEDINNNENSYSYSESRTRKDKKNKTTNNNNNNANIHIKTINKTYYEEEYTVSYSIRVLAISFVFFAPISWFLFGTNVRLMYGTVIIN